MSVVTFEHMAPAAVPEFCRPLGRADKIGEEHGRQHGVGHQRHRLASQERQHCIGHIIRVQPDPLTAELDDRRLRDASSDVTRCVAMRSPVQNER
jgi:hypothetical protein